MKKPFDQKQGATAGLFNSLLDSPASRLDPLVPESDICFMRMITEQSAESYLRERGHIGPKEKILLRELPGGVSNVVLYVTREDPSHDDFVLKQAREQLRVPEPWYCSVTRIWRESQVLRLCETLIQENVSREEPTTHTISTPRILFEDQENYLFAMSAAPPDHRTWKSELLEGHYSTEIATACGRLMGKLHCQSWQSTEIATAVGNRQFFEQLRIDPYYRKIAEVHEDLQPAIQRLIESLENHPLCLVHGDFSPKNLLVYQEGLMMVDFEVGHFGDPAFDLGFFLSHLILKAFHRPQQREKLLGLTESFWEAYRETLLPQVSQEQYQSLEARAIQNFAGCALARIDGKSKVEYLRDPECHESVRKMCRGVFRETPEKWSRLVKRISSLLAAT